MSEAEEIKRMGAKAQPNSGRGKHKKGDAILDGFLVDIKEYSKSFSLSQSVWGKLCADAHTAGRLIPALNVVLGQQGSRRLRLWVISEEEMQEYVRLRRGHSENGF